MNKNAEILIAIGIIAAGAYVVFKLTKPISDAAGAASNTVKTIADQTSNAISEVGGIFTTTTQATNDQLKALAGQGGKTSALGIAAVTTGGIVGVGALTKWFYPTIKQIVIDAKGIPAAATPAARVASIASGSSFSLFGLGLTPAIDIGERLGVIHNRSGVAI